jgi:uncharacterized protein YeaO (DUF488 family)
MQMKHRIAIKRVYDKPGPEDGRRILVDRLWPRGLRKEDARIDYWARDISPSSELRKWYGHDPAKWEEFKKRYFAELDQAAEGVDRLQDELGRASATFVYSSKEPAINNAEALRLYLESRSKRTKGPVRPAGLLPRGCVRSPPNTERPGTLGGSLGILFWGLTYWNGGPGGIVPPWLRLRGCHCAGNPEPKRGELFKTVTVISWWR